MPTATLVNDGSYLPMFQSGHPFINVFNDTGNRAYIGEIFSAQMKTILRFTLLATQGETIVGASLKLTASEPTGYGQAYTGQAYTLRADASDNASWPAGATAADKVTNAEGRTLTSASVSTLFTSSLEITPHDFDITNVIQEIVNRAGWVSGSSVLLFFSDYSSGVYHSIVTSEDANGPAPTLTFAGSAGSTNATSLVWMMIDEQETA